MMATAAPARLDDVDLTDLDRWVEGVPHDWFTLLRRDAPVFWQDEREGRGFWSLTMYDEVNTGTYCRHLSPNLFLK